MRHSSLVNQKKTLPSYGKRAKNRGAENLVIFIAIMLIKVKDLSSLTLALYFQSSKDKIVSVNKLNEGIPRVPNASM